MSEGLKIANEIYKRAKDRYNAPTDSYLGILMAVFVLSEPQNTDLWKRLAGYANSPEEVTAARAQFLINHLG